MDTEIILNLVNNRFKSDARRLIYANYIAGLVSRGIPPILSFRHLADILDVTPSELQGLAFASNMYYQQFSVPKRSGGKRTISSPYPLLDTIQTWISENILNKIFVEFPACVIGYISNKSIIDHVNPHVKSDQLVKFDLKGFFPSISKDSISQIFLDLGYSVSVSNTLASLVTLNNGLPQGARTSPLLSNVYMQRFDAAMDTYCREHSLIYTRYADDIVISGGPMVADLMPTLKVFFIHYGLTLNHAKTRLYKSPNQTRFITGLTLQNGQVRLPKSMRRRIRVQSHLFLHDFDKLLTAGVSYEKSEYPLSWKDRDFVFDPVFPERILGKLNFWLHIEPDNSYARGMINKIRERLNSL